MSPSLGSRRRLISRINVDLPPYQSHTFPGIHRKIEVIHRIKVVATTDRKLFA